jgi:predicted transcriptional regulator
MTEPVAKARSSKHSLLDLAPLELDCMKTLWPVGEATVREIRERLAPRLPRAYTTIMTIMDRLARKGVVERHKTGRAYVYRAVLGAEDARAQALRQVIENFFEGSKEALLAQLGNSPTALPAIAAPAPAAGESEVRADAAPPLPPVRFD